MAITFILNRCRSGWQIFQEDLITSSDLEKMGPSQRSDGLSTAVTNTLFVSVHPSPTTCALAPAPRAARTSAPSASAASKLNTLIGATHIYGPEYIVDCGKISTLGDVTFTINGKAYPLSGKDYVLQETEMGETICMSGFMGMDIQDGMWILGDIFMGRYYTVFDFENKQVGFAEAK